MDVLSPAQFAELRTELERELVRLRRSMGSAEEATGPVELDQTAIGRLSRVDAVANQQMQKELHERGQAREGRLLDALRRMEQGSYGRCAACGHAIPFGRLLVLPEASTCAGCGGI